ncbi:MAG: FAD-dependent oxidoreductase [Acidobacteriota bacterium]
MAIVGAGPGGLMTARWLEQKCGAACSVTVFEASPRIGGKLHTRTFTSADAAYESGVAECYGDVNGDDPLRTLVADLCLETVPTAGSTVVMQGHIIRDDEDLARVGGAAARAAVESFRAISAQALSIDEWRGRIAAEGAGDRAAAMTGTDLLELVDDDFARRYLALLAHSDLAAEPHQTSAGYALRKMVMGLPGYGSVYALRGGMEELPRRLAQRLTRTALELNARVVRLGREANGGYSLTVRRGRELSVEQADVVVLAVPHGALYAIECAGDQLRRNVAAHVAAYDRPGHYLRVSLLFDRIFWRAELPGAWFMLDAFGGCCVYDESARHHHESCGVLGWLMAGAEALMLCNADDGTLAELAVASLPGALSETARRSLRECRVHRWAGAVSARPGRPTLAGADGLLDRSGRGGLCVVGDYLFDATLNGVLRSAANAADLIAASLTSDTLRPPGAGLPGA